ncbi:MAG: DUF2339 domain-containing protein [Burkholderiaceae bacterium]|nr:MAG: DUF2339 domain-containing protein [Burkholderiaceae bacterium]
MWWIGAIVGLALGLASDRGSAFAYGFFGLVFGMLAKISLESQLSKLKDANMTLHEQAAAAMRDLRATIAGLESKIARLEAELLRFKSQARDVVQSSVAEKDERRAEAEVQAAAQTAAQATESPLTTAPVSASTESSVAVKATNDLASAVEPLPALDALVPEAVTTPQSDHALTEPLMLLEVPQLEEEKSAALSIPKEQAMATVQVTPEPELKTIVPEPVPAIKATPAARKLPAPKKPVEPEKPLRERLPAPIADLIYGGNLLVKVGILILFLGIAFLLRYAAERVTVPIEVRYAGVLFSGLVILGLGWRLREKRRDYALSLQGMAIGVFYLTVLSALKVHQIITPEAGMSFLLVVSVLSAALAVLQKAPVLAIVAALEGFVSPVLTSTGANRPLGLMTYLAILDIGIFLVAWFNAWRVLNLIAFVGTFTLAVGWADKFYTPADYGLIQPFLIFFFVLFALIGVLFARRTLLEAKHQAVLEVANTSGGATPLTGIKLVGRVDSALVFGNPLTAFGLQYLLVKHMEYGAAFSALAIAAFYLLLGRVIFSKQKQGLALLAEAYLIVAAIFATLAIPLGLESTWTSAAWAVEGAGMFWLGCRQQRPYARGFAYLVMAGATYKLLHAISIVTTPQQPLLQGALLGPVLLGLSALVMWHLHRRREASTIASWEAPFARLLPWLGLGALTLLPWMLLIPSFAAAACAVFGLVIGEASRRRDWPDWRAIGAVIQVGAVLSFLLGLHVDTNPNAQGFLEDGWRGMVPGLVIALSILFNAGRRMILVKRQAEAAGQPPAWTPFDAVASISGFALLHLSMLFAIDLTQAACIWPLTAFLVLCGALYMAQTPLAVFAMFMQGLSAVLYLQSHQESASDLFANWNFATQLSLAVAAILTADRMRHEAQSMRLAIQALSTPEGRAERLQTWLNPWCEPAVMQWLPLVWGVLWWLMGWSFEWNLSLKRDGSANLVPAVDIVLVSITSMLLLALAVWRKWPQAAKLNAMQLPLLYLACAFAAFQSVSPFMPLRHGGWWAWPIGLIWFYVSLRMQENYFSLPHKAISVQHVVGAWLALFLITAQVRGIFIQMRDLGEAWNLLATMLVPALALFAVSRRAPWKMWPLQSQLALYQQTAAAPIAVLLLWFVWGSNFNSAGAATPLPYLPLLNPLEIGLCLSALALFIWWRQLPEQASVRLPSRLAGMALALTAFAILSCGVLRAVHHYVGVDWDAHAMFDSRLAQAAVSITWAITGVGLMIFGNRRLQRLVWIAGAVLLAIVVAKLFLIELADRGGLYRIVSFIGVGLAFLVVGYFAPVPVKKTEATVDAEKGTTKAQSASASESREEGV